MSALRHLADMSREDAVFSRQCNHCRQPKEFPRIFQAWPARARRLEGCVLCFVEVDVTICRKCCILWKEKYSEDLTDEGRRMLRRSIITPSDRRFVCLICVQEKAHGLTTPLRNLSEQAKHQLSLITAWQTPPEEVQSAAVVDPEELPV